MDNERQHRFSAMSENQNGGGRAASQPPHQQQSPPLGTRYGNFMGYPASIGSRSSSFSGGSSSALSFSSRRAFSPQRFESTFEEDEGSESDLYYPSSYHEDEILQRGRLTYASSSGLGSRSQSLIPPTHHSQQTHSFSSSGAMAMSIPTRRLSISQQHQQQPSNQSPFVRDVGQILLEDGSSFRDLLWTSSSARGGATPSSGAGTHSLSSSAQDYLPASVATGGGASWRHGGGAGGGAFTFGTASARAGMGYDGLGGLGSSGMDNGTTSRRHSVSVVRPSSRPYPSPPPQSHQPQPQRQPLRMTGFDAAESTPTPSTPVMRSSSSGGLGFSDDDLALDLGMLGLGSSGPASAGPVSTGGAGDGYRLSTRPRGMSISPRDDRDPYHSPHFGNGHHPNVKLSTTPVLSNGGGAQQPQSPISPPTRHRLSSAPTMPPPVQGPQHPHPSHHPLHQQQQQMSESQMGRGIPLSSLHPAYKLFIVEFKAGRTDLFYLPPSSSGASMKGGISVNDLVIVEGDRGKDLGKVVNDWITKAEVEDWVGRQQQAHPQQQEDPPSPTTSTTTSTPKQIQPKLLLGLASPSDIAAFQSKRTDEEKALQLCQQKVRSKKMEMEVVDAEYQWDRKKLTFYFISDKRIDFRELVRELFRLYKTRIWMAALQAPAIPPGLAAASGESK